MAFVSKEKIDEIKSKNDIVDVIGSYISLNEKYKANCPFHTEKTPGAFSVHPDKQIYKCFSCGESGNVITFVQKYTGVSFAEALSILAERAGIKLDIKPVKKVDSRYEKYYEINDTVNKLFKNNLISSEGKEALKYLNDRTIDKDIINEFNIGLATKKIESILEKKYDVNDLIEIDIIKDINGKLYDSFQNRITFPIIDENNNVIAFSGRKYLRDDLEDKMLPKYSNTKETIIFKKSGTFYNINNALPNIKKSKEIIITEGFMDTIRMSSIGYKNVVALMGTALTKEHLDKIIKLKCKVVLNLDQDEAGKTASISIGKELEKNNIDVSVIVFDDYKDSDEFIIHKGKDAFDRAYNNRISFIDFELKYLKSINNMKSSVEISKYINSAINALNDIDDDILRELKIKELSTEFGIDESVIKSKLKEPVKKEVVEKKEVPKKRYNKYDISEIRILYLMLNYDDVILYFENSLGYLINPDRALLAYKIIEFRNEYGYFDYSDFVDYIIDNEKLGEVLKEVMKYHNEETYTEEELEDYINTIKKHSVEERMKKLESELKETLDVNKKIEIVKKIENMKKEVLTW